MVISPWRVMSYEFGSEYSCYCSFPPQGEPSFSLVSVFCVVCRKKENHREGHRHRSCEQPHRPVGLRFSPHQHVWVDLAAIHEQKELLLPARLVY